MVKNVTGYDLCKLMAGSWGTLAALTEVTIKTLPRPETEATVAMIGLDDAAAVKAMTAAMGSSCDVSGAAHLPAPVAGAIPLAEAAAQGRALTLLRLEGVAPSVAHRQAALTEIVKPFGEVGLIVEASSSPLWRAIRDVLPFAASRTGAEAPLWRVSTAPTRGAELARMAAAGTGADLPLRLGRRAHLAVDATGRATTLAQPSYAARWRLAAATPRLSARRRRCGPWWNRSSRRMPALAALTKRVKEGFDPKGVFNTGRMWAGV